MGNYIELIDKTRHGCWFQKWWKHIEKDIEKQNCDMSLKNRCGAGVICHILLHSEHQSGCNSRGVPNSLSIEPLMSSSPHSTIVPSDSDINDAIPPPQVIIALPVVLSPSLVLSLSPIFDSRDFFPSKKISSPKDTKTPVGSPITTSPSSSVGSSSPVRSTTSPPDYLFNESIFAELDNSLWIISRPLGSEPDPEEPNTCYNVHLWISFIHVHHQGSSEQDSRTQKQQRRTTRLDLSKI
ncbi:reverse transcriptase domain-containing protein [Tanacetum coccineum]